MSLPRYDGAAFVYELATAKLPCQHSIICESPFDFKGLNVFVATAMTVLTFTPSSCAKLRSVT